MACSLDRPPKTTATRGLRVPFTGDAACSSSLMVRRPYPSRCGVPVSGSLGWRHVFRPVAAPARSSRRGPTPGYRPHRRGARRAVPPRPDHPLNIPLTFASTYVAGGDPEYGRYGNPTWTAFEHALGDLEAGRPWRSPAGWPRSRPSSTWSARREGGRAAARLQRQHHAAGRPGGLRPHPRALLVDVTDTDAVVKALRRRRPECGWSRPRTPRWRSPTSPPIVAAAHEAGAYVVVDNTFATPLLQQPLSN